MKRDRFHNRSNHHHLDTPYKIPGARPSLQALLLQSKVGPMKTAVLEKSMHKSLTLTPDSGDAFFFTMRAAPHTFRGFFQFRVQAHKMIGTRAGVTKDDLTALLTNFAIILVISLVAAFALSNACAGCGALHLRCTSRIWPTAGDELKGTSNSMSVNPLIFHRKYKKPQLNSFPLSDF